jgi:hypothetical protein
MRLKYPVHIFVYCAVRNMTIWCFRDVTQYPKLTAMGKVCLFIFPKVTRITGYPLSKFQTCFQISVTLLLKFLHWNRNVLLWRNSLCKREGQLDIWAEQTCILFTLHFCLSRYNQSNRKVANIILSYAAGSLDRSSYAIICKQSEHDLHGRRSTRFLQHTCLFIFLWLSESQLT